MAGEWTEQLSDDLKANEAFTSFNTVSDFANAHLENVGKVSDLDGKVKTHEGTIKDLESKLASSIPKLGEKPTDEERAAFLEALDVPKSPDEYEFSAEEGQENSPEMVAWAKKTFHSVGVPKDTAAYIGKEFNAFIKGLETANKEAAEAAKAEADTKLKAEWGADYDKNLEFTKRGWKKFTDTEFDAFCDDTGIGNDARLAKFIFKVGTAMGDDFSPPGSQQGSDKTNQKMDYGKSPTPPTA